MLPAASRLRRRSDFSSTLRRGGAARGGGLVVVHLAADDPLVEQGSGAPARVGFVVSRAVGPAVTRNLVRRRLRHLMARHLPQLPSGVRVVVRALPASSRASFAELDSALDSALGRALGSALSTARARARKGATRP